MLNIGKYLDEAGHIASILGYAGHLMGGKELPTDSPEEGVATIKGLAGFLGLKDERTVLSLMTRLFNHKPKDNPTEGERAHYWVTKHKQHLEDQFDLLKPQIGRAAAIMKVIYKNRYRNMLVDLPSSGGSKTGTLKEVKKLKRSTITTTDDRYGKGSSDGLDFLLLWGNVLQQKFDETDESLSQEEREILAFEATNPFLKAHQMPLPPKPGDIPYLIHNGKRMQIKSIRLKRELEAWLRDNVPEYWEYVKNAAMEGDTAFAAQEDKLRNDYIDETGPYEHRLLRLGSLFSPWSWIGSGKPKKPLFSSLKKHHGN